MEVKKSWIQEDLETLQELGKYLDRRMRRKFAKNCDVRTYLMRKFLKIRNKNGKEVPLRPNKAQRIIASKWGQKNIVLKARQLGMSTYVSGRYFIDTITRPGTLSVQVAHDQRSAEDIFRMVHRFQEKLPESLREGALKTSRSNARQLRWTHLDSEYRVETAADPNAGRGMTIRNLHCSEVAMWPRDGGEALVSLRAAVPPSGQVVLESTPNGAGGAFYEEWHAAAETGYVQHFLPWWVEKGYRRPGLAPANPTPEEEELKRRHGLDDEQLAYRRELRANCRGKFAQEYAENAEECFLLSGDCVFDVQKVDQRLKECEMPKPRNNAIATRDNGRELVWFPPQPKHEYIIGVDTAGGGSNGDYACAQVIDRATGMQCAELHGHFDPRETADRVVKLAKEYNHALLVIERNNHGSAVHQRVVDAHAYANTYENRMNLKNGWQTMASNKPQIIQFLGDLLIEQTHLFASIRFLRECRTFLRNADGSSSAASGAHDDTVMAMAIAQFVRNITAGRRSLCAADTPVREASACADDDVNSHPDAQFDQNLAPQAQHSIAPHADELAPQARHSIARHVSAGYT